MEGTIDWLYLSTSGTDRLLSEDNVHVLYTLCKEIINCLHFISGENVIADQHKASLSNFCVTFDALCGHSLCYFLSS